MTVCIFLKCLHANEGEIIAAANKKDTNYVQLLTAPLIKRKVYDQLFGEKPDWDIVYPGCASSFPGQPDTPFCLSKPGRKYLGRRAEYRSPY
jgi:hypothetical protein